jgi:hypothetical protein
LRFSRIQLTRNPLRALRSGFLTFDQLQLATLVKTTSITEAEALPSTMQLFPAYPNPFNPTTAMRYTVPVVALSPELVEGSKGGQRTVSSGQRPMVSLKVYDMLGREVATLVHAPQAPGTYTVTWNAAGQASGVYLVRMAAGRYAGTQKIVLLK